MDSPERPFAADYAGTLDRLIDEAGEAQDGHAVRIFQRFRETPFRGFAALFPRPYDPGKSPLVNGPMLDQRWEDDAYDLFERAMAAQAGLPADADRDSRRSAQFFRGLAEVLWACFRDEAQALRAEAYALALGQLENADPDLVRFHQDLANEAWAMDRLTTSVDVARTVLEWEGDAENLKRSVREIGAAAKTFERACDRSVRSWARVRAKEARRPGIPAAVMHPRSRARRRRAAARRAAGPRSGQDPGGSDLERRTP